MDIGTLVKGAADRATMGPRLGVSPENQQILDDAYESVFRLWAEVYAARVIRKARRS